MHAPGDTLFFWAQIRGSIMSMRDFLVFGGLIVTGFGLWETLGFWALAIVGAAMTTMGVFNKWA